MAKLDQTPTCARNDSIVVPPKESVLPSSWRPYVELMRIRVFTTIIMYSPYLYGCLFAAAVSPTSVPLSQLLLVATKLLISALLSHSWACTWNDVVDYDLDREVERCRDRPIARGAVTPQAGVLFTATQILVWLQYHAMALPEYSIYGLFAGVLAILYPFSKRVTSYTPVVLGIIFAWGTLLGYVSIGGQLAKVQQSSQVPLGLLALSGYTLAWVVNFETIYAFQDLRDDAKAGIKSMAVRYQHSAGRVFGASIFVETVLLIFVGQVIKGGFAYYILGPFLHTCLQLWAQFRIDVNKPADCTSFFKRTPITATALISASLVSVYFERAAVESWLRWN